MNDYPNEELTAQENTSQTESSEADSSAFVGVAYKVKATQFQLLLEKSLTALGALTIFGQIDRLKIYTPNENDLELLGIQFEFKSSTGAYLENIAIFQIYYFAPLQRFIKFQPHFDQSLTELSNDLMYEIKKSESNSNEDNVFPSYYMSNNDLPVDSERIQAEVIDFKKLEFFEDQLTQDVGFVYFTKDQLYHIVKYYASSNGDIILSGCQLNLGKKLVQRQEDSSVDNAPYFTLKLEGREGDEADFSLDEGMSPEVYEAPDMAIAHPCPPKWFLFSVFYQQVKINNPLVTSSLLKQNWEQVIPKGAILLIES